MQLVLELILKVSFRVYSPSECFVVPLNFSELKV
jgi:hypothetical protein